MGSGTLRRITRTCVALCWLVWAPSVWGETNCDAEPKPCAKAAFEAGNAAYDREDFSSAVTHFRRAQALTPHPVIAFNLAQAEIRAGLLLEAVATLEALLDDPKTPGDLRKRAKAAQTEATNGVAHVQVVWPGQPKLDIVVDGKPLTNEDSSFAVNPGRHVLRVAPPGREPVEQEVELAHGERLQLRVSGSTRRMDVILPGGASPKGSASKTDTSGSAGLSPIWFYAAGGATALFVGASIWSGVDTNSAHSKYKRDLPTLTESEAQRRLNDGHNKERRTNILWGLSAIGALATGAIGVFSVDWSPDAQAGTSFVVTGDRVLVTGHF